MQLCLPLIFLLLHLTSATPPPLPHLNLTITTSKTYQTIRGFGIGLSPSSPDALLSLAEPHQSDVFSLLFNTSSEGRGAGAGFSILRLELDSSASTSPPNRKITWGGPQVWVAQEAIRKFGLRSFYASAGASAGGGKGERWATGYGRYLARFVREYWERAIPVAWIGLVDDPEKGDRQRALDAAGGVREELDEIGLGEVGVGCCEDRGWADVNGVMAEAKRAGLDVVTAWRNSGTSVATEELVDTALPVWVTGKGPGMGPKGMSDTWYRNGDENEGLGWALNIHYALTVGNVGAYIHRIGISRNTEEAPLIRTLQGVTSAAVPYTVGPAYWAAAQFSRFIRPGARRIRIEQHSDTDELTIRSSAFENENGGIVAQVINNGDQAATARFSFPGLLNTERVCTYETWLTDDERRLARISNPRPLHLSGVFDTTLASRSLTSVILKCN
ncbi:hypothetical protein MFIFM68171_08223 [Madurella fahalii]|uniref:Non-reducing end alpha-L-arabinofuranosidase n=1 Tax=Madurella fahalii TaxID=1157608 RepID=A0ABQ0GJR9_9PEZI